MERRRARRVLEGLHARRLSRSGCTRPSHSCCARATSRRSTCSTARSRCSVRRHGAAAAPDRDRRRRRRWSRIGDFSEPVGPERTGTGAVTAGVHDAFALRQPRRRSLDAEGLRGPPRRRRVVDHVRARGRRLRRRRRLHRPRRRSAVAAARGRRPSRLTTSTFVWIGGIVVPVVILSCSSRPHRHTTRGAAHARDGPAPRRTSSASDWWWDVRVSRAPPSSPPTRSICRSARRIEIRLDVRRRHPQLLGSPARRQGRPHPRPAQRLALHGHEAPASYRGRVRGVLRAPARQHGRSYVHRGVAPASLRTVASPHSAIRRVNRLPSSPPTAQLAFQAPGVRRVPHGPRHRRRPGTIGPDLTDFGSRQLHRRRHRRQHARRNLAGWIVDAQHVQAREHACPRSHCRPATCDSIVAYLESLK